MDYFPEWFINFHFIFPTAYYYPNAPDVEYSEEYGLDRVNVSLNWSQEAEILVSHRVCVLQRKDTEVLCTNSEAKATVILHYNVQYNVSVSADFCGLNSNTTLIDLNYGECKVLQWSMVEAIFIHVCLHTLQVIL